MQTLLDNLTKGDLRSAARLIRMIDDNQPAAWDALKKLFPHTRRARVIGITGPPGAGKSTLTSCLIECIRQQNKSVGVLAVDPSSPISGGAILGDRIRMSRHTMDKEVFIRSLASRGHFGGVTPATRGAIRVMDAMGKDYIIVETVGVGQDEVDIARLADTTVIVWVPGLGDDIQAMKAGILEVADIFVVNKAEHPDAPATANYLKSVFKQADKAAAIPRDWMPPVVETVATRNEGIDNLWNVIVQHAEYTAQASDYYLSKKHEACKIELKNFVLQALNQKLAARIADSTELDQQIAHILDGRADIYEVTDSLLKGITSINQLEY
jgi:LAO/AO transport system kinase